MRGEIYKSRHGKVFHYVGITPVEHKYNRLFCAVEKTGELKFIQVDKDGHFDATKNHFFDLRRVDNAQSI